MIALTKAQRTAITARVPAIGYYRIGDTILLSARLSARNASRSLRVPMRDLLDSQYNDLLTVATVNARTATLTYCDPFTSVLTRSGSRAVSNKHAALCRALLLAAHESVDTLLQCTPEERTAYRIRSSDSRITTAREHTTALYAMLTEIRHGTTHIGRTERNARLALSGHYAYALYRYSPACKAALLRQRASIHPIERVRIA